jgi:tetratricopeptide (TPR) repeat protein
MGCLFAFYTIASYRKYHPLAAPIIYTCIHLNLVRVMRSYVLLFALMLPVWAFSQNNNEFNYNRKPLKEVDESDSLFLMELIRAGSQPNTEFSFTLVTNELQLDISKKDIQEPADFKTIEKTEKKLLKTTDRAERAMLYLQMGLNYKKLNRSTLSRQAYENAFTEITPVLETSPNDSAALFLAANIKMSSGQYAESIGFCERLKVINNNCDVYASSVIPMLYLGMGKIEEAANFVYNNLKKWPEGEIGMYYNLLVQIYSFMQLAQYRQEYIYSDRFLTTPVDSILDVSKLYALYKKYPDDIKWEQFYKSSLLLGISLKYAAISSKNASIKNNFSFAPNIADTDLTLLKNLTIDFKRIVADKRNNNPFLAQKVLGFILFLQKDYKAAMGYFEKAIKEKKPAISDSESNSAAVYNNLIACLLEMKDTAKSESVLKEKIKKKPAFDPEAMDYVYWGYYYFKPGQLTTARKNFEKAIETDSACKNAYVGLAYCELWEGKPAGAIVWINKALTIDANFGEAYWVYGLASLLRKDANSAYIILKTAYKLDYCRKDIREVMDMFFAREQ